MGFIGINNITITVYNLNGQFRIVLIQFIQIRKKDAAVLYNFHYALRLIGGIIIHTVHGKVISALHIRIDFSKLFIHRRQTDIFITMKCIYLFIPGLLGKNSRLADAESTPANHIIVDGIYINL